MTRGQPIRGHSLSIYIHIYLSIHTYSQWNPSSPNSPPSVPSSQKPPYTPSVCSLPKTPTTVSSPSQSSVQSWAPHSHSDPPPTLTQRDKCHIPLCSRKPGRSTLVSNPSLENTRLEWRRSSKRLPSVLRPRHRDRLFLGKMRSCLQPLDLVTKANRSTTKHFTPPKSKRNTRINRTVISTISTGWHKLIR